jgi:hypothetical protein
MRHGAVPTFQVMVPRLGLLTEVVVIASARIKHANPGRLRQEGLERTVRHELARLRKTRPVPRRTAPSGR